MTDLSIYHNPRCSKSRQTLALLEEQNVGIHIVEYLKSPPTVDELSKILQQLGFTARQLLRTGEAVYKELNLKETHFTDEQLIQAMCDNPKLIERPIVIHNGKAKIGRPPESVLELL